ncbi:DUF4926 domain-containing protein [Pseudobacteroides cellulosolvens]|uniref:DUF4926 domain-containing protein n=1 Tax=Pseudobacteroides cellulosolvens ATCC 35603 = DSM 2933 TaxID=398512 RepID=A0A0L6JIN5_9FIRM|nr:DUF4926 domain-containing protein [Pseudobacteroides cellulosolvens]KNY25682.1 hypothetical protein Bccel_0942 [Pseudobacteroides cellulosolvens ATCC 35603 = DSM 2933]KNY25696.1 hypothetical protein Bccel_0956 [Pseudobacteroides cellulosolvens ATCC 35603 = DSM 2933]
MKEFDVVELLCDIPEHSLIKGQKGTILEIYSDVDCEIEICDDEGLTQFLGTLKLNDLKKV